MVPLTTPHRLAEFVLEALSGPHSPYLNPKQRYAKGDLGHINSPEALLVMNNSQIDMLNSDFRTLIGYCKSLIPLPSSLDLDDRSDHELMDLAASFIRTLLINDWHLTHVGNYFSSMQDPVSTVEELIRIVSSDFAPPMAARRFVVYTPRLLGLGGKDFRFKLLTWSNLPVNVQYVFQNHLASIWRVVPQQTERSNDAEYVNRYQKWQIEAQLLTLTRFLSDEIKALDMYTAAETFHQRYQRMKSIQYISRKKTGSSSQKSDHNTHRNSGGTPPRLDDYSVVAEQEVMMPDGETIVIRPKAVYQDSPTFPYQKLKNEFERQTELLHLFYDHCAIFRQLTVSYANAIEAFSRNDTEDVFRNLVIATELSFATDESGISNAKRSLIDNGTVLLTLDWLRGQVQALTFLIKRQFPSRMEGQGEYMIHMNIIRDDLWIEFCNNVNVPRIYRWRREELMTILHDPSIKLQELRNRYEAEVLVLWYARHQYAHRALVFKDGYFTSLLLNLFRIVLDIRFSAYAIWLEGEARRVVRGGNDGPDWKDFEALFAADGWRKEFGLRVGKIVDDFNIIKSGKLSESEKKSLLLGAGYAGLGVLPNRQYPVKRLIDS